MRCTFVCIALYVLLAISSAEWTFTASRSEEVNADAYHERRSLELHKNIYKERACRFNFKRYMLYFGSHFNPFQVSSCTAVERGNLCCDGKWYAQNGCCKYYGGVCKCIRWWFCAVDPTPATTAAATTAAATTAAPTTAAATTAAPTTAAATTAAPTTAAATTPMAVSTTSPTARSFCPDAATLNRTRMINGKKKTYGCDVSRVVKVFDDARSSQVCLGTLVGENTIRVPPDCKTTISARAGGTYSIKAGPLMMETDVPIDLSNTAKASTPGDLSLSEKVADYQCPGFGCYFQSSMKNQVDWTRCKFVSQGNAAAGQPAMEMTISSVTGNDECRAKINAGAVANAGDTTTFYTYNCFSSDDIKTETCQEGAFGEMYCETASGEFGVVGSLPSMKCGAKDTFIAFQDHAFVPWN